MKIMYFIHRDPKVGVERAAYHDFTPDGIDMLVPDWAEYITEPNPLCVVYQISSDKTEADVDRYIMEIPGSSIMSKHPVADDWQEPPMPKWDGTKFV